MRCAVNSNFDPNTHACTHVANMYECMCLRMRACTHTYIHKHYTHLEKESPWILEKAHGGVY